MRPVAILYIACLACQPLLARPAEKSSPILNTPGPVPVRLLQGYLLVVRGRIGAADGLAFVLDTGATRSTIDRQVLERLAIPARRHAGGSVLSFDKRVAVEAVEVEDIAIGSLEFGELTVAVSDLGYFRPFAGRVDGVIGLDVLARSPFTIDFAKRQVVFGASLADLPGVNGKAHVAEMTREPDYFSVELDTGGQRLHLAVDTGLRGIVLYDDRLSDHSVDYRVIDRVFGVRLGGVLRSEVAILDRLSIGGEGLDPRVTVTAAPPGVKVRPDGFFGLASLRARRVSFDFERQILSWSN